MNPGSLGQKWRLAVFIAYVAALVAVSHAALGSWLPPFTEKGLWFYSGLFALLLGGLIEAPFFTSPRGALSFGSFAMIPLLGFGLWNEPASLSLAYLIWLATGAYVAAVLLASLLAIVGLDAKNLATSRLGEAGYATVQVLGGPRAIFTMVFVFALANFHAESTRELLYIGLSWPIIVVGQPLERLVTLVRRYVSIWKLGLAPNVIGQVVGHGVPGTLTVRHPASKSICAGDLLLVPGDDHRANIAVALGRIGTSEALWVRALQLDLPPTLRKRLPDGLTKNGGCGVINKGDLYDEVCGLRLKEVQDAQRLVGLVAPGTDIQSLRFEVLRTDVDLEEGCLLGVQVGEQQLLYQVVNGMTRQEIVQRKDTRGYVEGIARKIGYWNRDEEHFESIPWLPLPNQPVYVIEGEPGSIHEEAIGYFPRTAYRVSVNIEELITHNAAILGILGIGKSFLALELVERMLSKDVGVICLDLTDQYQDELTPYVDGEFLEGVVTRLEASAAGGREAYARNKEEGGKVQEFKAEISAIMREFLSGEQEARLLILDPTRLEVWQQTGGMFQEKAAMATLTPAQITRIITEAALEAVQAMGRTESARCCLVFEEAHSLIPEFTAIADEGDKEATNGTARAILQGRKYGLGCLVVTQRTASVTKTILNQCNTMFAMRVFDATGMDFLSNYIGDQYASVLATLEDRHVIVAGKASSCRDPVRVRVNERDEFLEVTRG